jgi:hypothetical protein
MAAPFDERDAVAALPEGERAQRARESRTDDREIYFNRALYCHRSSSSLAEVVSGFRLRAKRFGGPP